MLILLRCAWVKNKRAKCVIEQPSWRNIGCFSVCGATLTILGSYVGSLFLLYLCFGT